jgi:CubicO group peptidase (beta-lactamase class C family)
MKTVGTSGRSMVSAVGLLLLLFLLLACGRSSVAPTPGDEGLLDAAMAAARQEPNLTSVVALRGGVVLREYYAAGSGVDTTHPVWSVTKSVLSLAVGAALDRGCLHSLDQTLPELLGTAAVSDPAKARITLRHILTMTTGLDCPEMPSYSGETNLYQTWTTAPDQLAWVLDRPLSASPGERFEYGSATFHLASVALTRACGDSAAEYASSAIFSPVGIPPRTWGTDRQGFSNGGAGLELSPRDMGAIGTLVLDSGRAYGRQVIASGWIQDMTRAQVATGPGMPAPGYGYGWWRGQAAGLDIAFAMGWGGQFIFVIPSKGAVVTATSATTGVSGPAALEQWQRVFTLLTTRVIPAL